jgi:hypothetical protein
LFIVSQGENMAASDDEIPELQTFLAEGALDEVGLKALAEALRENRWSARTVIDQLPWKDKAAQELSQPDLVSKVATLVMITIGELGFWAGDAAIDQLERTLAPMPLYRDLVREYKDTKQPWLQAGLELEQAERSLHQATSLEQGGLAVFWQASAMIEQNLSVLTRVGPYCLFPNEASLAAFYVPKIYTRICRSQVVCLDRLRSTHVEASNHPLCLAQIAVSQLQRLAEGRQITPKDMDLVALPFSNDAPPYATELPQLAGYYLTLSTLLGQPSEPPPMGRESKDLIDDMTRLERVAICQLPAATADQLPAYFDAIAHCIDELEPIACSAWDNSDDAWAHFLEHIWGQERSTFERIELALSDEIRTLAIEEQIPDFDHLLYLARQYTILLTLPRPFPGEVIHSIRREDLPLLLELGAQREGDKQVEVMQAQIHVLEREIEIRRSPLAEAYSAIKESPTTQSLSRRERRDQFQSLRDQFQEILDRGLIALHDIIEQFPRRFGLLQTYLSPESLRSMKARVAHSGDQFLTGLYCFIGIEILDLKHELRKLTRRDKTRNTDQAILQGHEVEVKAAHAELNCSIRPDTPLAERRAAIDQLYAKTELAESSIVDADPSIHDVTHQLELSLLSAYSWMDSQQMWIEMEIPNKKRPAI